MWIASVFFSRACCFFLRLFFLFGRGLEGKEEREQRRHARRRSRRVHLLDYRHAHSFGKTADRRSGLKKKKPFSLFLYHTLLRSATVVGGRTQQQQVADCSFSSCNTQEGTEYTCKRPEEIQGGNSIITPPVTSHTKTLLLPARNLNSSRGR